MTRDRSESIGWCCVAAVVIIFVAGLLVGVRDTIGNTNVALILVVFVVAAAVFGGRLAGITAAAVAAISFNFFHTQPYLTLRIKEGQDVVTVILLLVVGLVVGELAILRRRTQTEAVTQASGAHVLEGVVALLAADATVDETWAAVRDAVQQALGVHSARFIPGADAGDIPLLTRSGRVVPALSRWTGQGFQLPEQIAVPVVAQDRVLGHLAIASTPGRSVSVDERRVAVALADLLAVVLERSPGHISQLS
jgi:K+-sensing histidine kinase KdpD